MRLLIKFNQMKYCIVVCLTSIIFATSCNTKAESKKNMDIQPPKADKIAKNLEIPVRFIGIGEGIDDLRPFNSKQFIDALFTD